MLDSRESAPFALPGEDAPLPLPMRVVLVDPDELFRDTLCRGLSQYAMEVKPFATKALALSYLANEQGCDVALEAVEPVDSQGQGFLPELRRFGIQVPVIVLTEQSGPDCETFEYSALTTGAADVVDKSRGLRIIAKRIELVARRARSRLLASSAKGQSRRLEFSGLVVEDHSALWKERRVPLTVTEFRIVRLLAVNAGEYISYRQIYDLVHGKDFIAGRGIDGHRTNVRSVIRRIRLKFCQIDEEFTAIENSPNRGYRWQKPGDDGERSGTRPH